MKYGIVENNKLVLIDDDLQRLKNTLLFMPQYSVDQIKSYEDSQIEQSYDGNWYLSGHAPVQPLEEARAAKLAEINAAFTTASETARCLSSSGFEINADETANRNISSLIIAMEATGDETVRFCAFDNTFHEATLTQLKTMQLEIIANAQTIYQRKWVLREQINAAQTVGELEAIDITFETVGQAQGDGDGQTA